MTIIRRSYRIETIKNRRSRRIAAKATVFLPSTTTHIISRNKRRRQKIKVIPDGQLLRTLRSRIVLFKYYHKKVKKSQDSKNILALKARPERDSIQVRRSPCRSLHKHILKETNKEILALQTSPQRKSRALLSAPPPLRISPRLHNQGKLSLRRSPRRNLFMDKQYLVDTQ